MKTWPIPLLCALALLLTAGCRREAPEPAGDAGSANAPLATEPAPDVVPDPDDADEPDKPSVPSLQVDTIDGTPYDLAEHRGKWVVVNFWATWCAPCLKEMPELSALGTMRDHIEVIGLAYEEVEPETMRAFLQKHPVLYSIAIVDVYDPPADFDTPPGLPMTYLIAPDGTVAKQFLGPVTAHEIETAIAAAGGPEVPQA